MTDKEILDLLKVDKNVDRAFACIVKTYSKKMYWHIRRIVNDHDDANDIVQNAMIKTWKGLSNFKGDAQLYTWLYRIATNEAITFLNSNKKRATMQLQNPDYELSQSITAEPWMDGDAASKKLERAIDALPMKQKQVFVMRYYDEMKYEEMEQLLGTSAGALKASYHHAVKKIENYLKED